MNTCRETGYAERLHNIAGEMQLFEMGKAKTTLENTFKSHTFFNSAEEHCCIIYTLLIQSEIRGPSKPRIRAVTCTRV